MGVHLLCGVRLSSCQEPRVDGVDLVHYHMRLLRFPDTSGCGERASEQNGGTVQEDDIQQEQDADNNIRKERSVACQLQALSRGIEKTKNL